MSVDREVGQRQIWGTPEAREEKRNYQRRERGRRKEEKQKRVLS